MLIIILTLLISFICIWISAAVLANSYEAAKRKKYLWRVSKKFPNEKLRGQVVRIEDGDDTYAVIRTINSVSWKEKVYDQYLPSGQYSNKPSLHTRNSILSDSLKKSALKKYLKRVPELTSKGGEKKKVKRMPRIFKYALYAALVVLVWDVVSNANNIAMFMVQHFILVHK